MQAAPLFNEISDGPPKGYAHWLTAADGVRLRIGVWPEGEKGTVLLFPGRTEYIEKYGRAAADLNARGYATLAIDWRGQGLADRLLDEPSTGHVNKFQDYQLDVQAAVKAADDMDLPRPYYLLGHSMGGAIGLRALIQGLDVKAAAFSAPMWGILIAPVLRPFAWAISTVARKLGLGHKLAPGTQAETYVVASPYQDNMLTTDAEMFNYMRSQITAHPELALGGPSLQWLNEALIEARKLAAVPPPKIPTLTGLGTRERIVDAAAIRAQMRRWKNGALEIFEGSEHEIMMEDPKTRARFFDQACALFDAHR